MNPWVEGARPSTLPAALAPVAVGTGVAAPNLHIINGVLALIVALSLQIAVNYANDYSDGVRGTDSNRVGPTRLVASGLATATAVKRAAYLAFAVAAVAGLVASLRTSLWLVGVGAVAIVAAWNYTGGENPYGYRGLGEIFVFIFFGVVAVVGTAFLHTQQLSSLAFIASIPVGMLACALLVVNNLRDRATDAASNKTTLAVRLGDQKTRALFVVLVLAPFVLAVAVMPWRNWSPLALVALPVAIYTSRYVAAGAVGPDLIKALRLTGQVQLLFALFFTVGLAI